MWLFVSSLALGVFKSRVLRKILGPEREELSGEWRELYIEELHAFLTNIIFKIKSMRMGCVGHVAYAGEEMNAYRFWQVNLKERDYLGNLLIDGRIVVKYILMK
jgi:hypothetical protein